MNFAVIADNWRYFFIGAYPDGPLGGIALTLVLSIVSALASGVLGLFLGIALSISHGWVYRLLVAFLGFFRAIPVIMLIFWVYFLLPMLFGIDAPGTLTVVCALSLIGSAYLAHSVYAGITSLPKGQMQVAKALGLTLPQALRYVVLPQALPIMLPSFINQWVSLIKDTSLAYVIGVSELSFVATQISNREMIYPAEIFLFIGLIYYIFCVGLSSLSTFFMNKYQARRVH